MKLNLLPTYVSKESQAKGAIFLSAALALISVAAAVGMIVYGKKQLESAKATAQFWEPKAKQALDTSKQADTIMQGSVVIDRNVKLAKAMTDHSTVYPNLYDEVLRYTPRYFRVTSIAASSVDDKTAVVRLTGVIQNVQQYADIMLALLRIPGVVNVSRTGFVDGRMQVPNLTEIDQIGLPVVPGAGNIPSDARQKMDRIIADAEAAPRGYLDTGGFGTLGSADRGAMPGWSQIGLAVTLQRNLQTPDPRATLNAQGAAGAQAPASSPAGGTPNRPAGTPNQPRRGGEGDE